MLHLKLNELITSTQGASNRLINAQDFLEAETKVLHDFHCILVGIANRDNGLSKIHSVEEAEDNHNEKLAAHTG